MNNIQIYFLQEESIMKRNGTNARNAFEHFLSKEEHKESKILGSITMLAKWPINHVEEKESIKSHSNVKYVANSFLHTEPKEKSVMERNTKNARFVTESSVEENTHEESMINHISVRSVITYFTLYNLVALIF